MGKSFSYSILKMEELDYLRFYRALGEVLSVSPKEAETLVVGYTTGDLPFFEAYFARFPVAQLNYGDNKGNGLLSLFVKEANSNKGAFGSVVRNRVGLFAYKTIVYTPNFQSPSESRKKYLGLLFKETIIQVLLQTDPTYGHHVNRIFKLYRNGSNAILKMEQLDRNLRYIYSDRSSTVDKTLRSEELKQILLKLFEILIYFRDRYGFYHWDLHYNNVMTVAGGDILAKVSNLKLIDFGLSEIKIKDITFVGERVFGDGYNICSFIMSFEPLTKAFQTVLNTLTDLPDLTTPLETYQSILSATSIANVGGYRMRTTRRSHCSSSSRCSRSSRCRSHYRCSTRKLK